MTMHLVRGMTTLNNKKRKSSKMTKAKEERLIREHREHNKQMKRLNCHSNIMTFEEYVDYVHGRYKPKSKPTATNFSWSDHCGYTRESPKIPSLSTGASFGPATKRESLQYTGERKLVGIAMMHKSNLVPVFADEDDKDGSKQATEIAQMRRN